MEFLSERVFDKVLSSENVPSNVKSGVRLTMGRMRKLSAVNMIKYYWSALSRENGIKFSEKLLAERLPRFEDIAEEFTARFNDEWLKS